MTTVDFTLSGNVYKHFEKKSRGISKIHLKREPRLYYAKDKRGPGAQGLGKFYEIIEFFIDNENRVFVGYRTNDDSGNFYQYAMIGQVRVEEAT